MSPEVQALVALRTWAESKPGVARVIPRELRRGERGPFGRYRGGDGGQTPFEISKGLAEGVHELDPVTAINRPQLGDCTTLRRCEIPAALPPWERAGRIAMRGTVRASLAGGDDFGRMVESAGFSRQAAIAILGMCDTCGELPGRGEDEPTHQPWCPEVGGWWCNACQSWSGASVRCSTCCRQKSEARDWSPYRNCPACDLRLPEDCHRELASCSCGWKEGE